MGANLRGFSNGPVVVRPLDEEQARLVEILHAAGGTPVSFEQLRALGIENPATLAYELEIAGLSIMHVQRAVVGGETVHAGIQLESVYAEVSALGAPRAGRGHFATALVRLSTASAGWAAKSLEKARVAGRPVRGPRRHRARQADQQGGAPGGTGAPRALGRRCVAHLSGAIPRPGLHAGPPLSGLAALLALGAVTAGLVSGLGGSRASRRTDYVGPARSRSAQPRAPGRSPNGQMSAALHPAARSPASPTPAARAIGTATSTSPRRAASVAELQAEGHRLLEAGNYSAAVSDLRAAIRASGQSSQGCAEAASSACLTYAYALYDLGRTLQLDNHPAAAVSVLRERLLIDYQRPVVRQELAVARHGLQRRSPDRSPARASPHPSVSPSSGAGAKSSQPQLVSPPGQPKGPAAGGRSSTPREGEGQHVSATGGLQAPSGEGAPSEQG